MKKIINLNKAKTLIFEDTAKPVGIPYDYVKNDGGDKNELEIKTRTCTKIKYNEIDGDCFLEPDDRMGWYFVFKPEVLEQLGLEEDR